MSHGVDMAISTAMLTLDGDGRIAHASAAAERLFGYSPGELRTLPLSRLLLVPGADARRPGGAAEWLRDASTKSGPQDVKVITASGRWLDFHAHCESFLFNAQPAFTIALHGSKEQVDTEGRVLVSETFLQRIVDTAGDAIISAGAEGRVTLFNPMAEHIFGYRADEVLGRPLDILLPVRSRDSHGKMMAAFARGPAPTRMMGQRGQISGLRKDGTEFQAEAAISHFTIDGATIFTAVLRDVTELHRAERERRKSTRLFQAVFNQTFQFLGILRPDGTIVEINDAAVQFGNVPREHAIGAKFCSFASWCHSDEARKTIGRAVKRAASGEFVRFEVPLAGTNGGERIIDFSIKPIFDETDDISLLIFEGRDITERVLATRALALSEARLSNAQRIAKLGNWDWNIRTGDLYWSDEVFWIFGYERTRFGATYGAFLDCVHPDDRSIVKEAVRAALANKSPYNIDHRIVLPSGEIRIVHEQGELTYDENGAPVRMTGIVQDITEQKEVENNLRAAKLEAEAASQAKSDFLANMSHELRTPLNAIIGFSEVMVRELYGPITPEKYRSYTEQIFESGQHLLGLINNILDMSKIEAGQMALSESRVDLTSVLESCARLFSPRVQEGGIIVLCNWEADLARLAADELMLRQIVINLLSNAVKFTPSGGSVWIRAYRNQDGGLTIKVKDTGIGMAGSDIPKALELFGQIDNSFTRKYDGTGLGLPLTASLVKLHGGRLWIESEPGRGTTVTVDFPSHRVLEGGDWFTPLASVPADRSTG